MATDDDPLVCLAEVLAPHGVRGLLRLRCHTEVPEDVAAYGPLVDERGRRYRTTVHGRHKGGLLVALDGIGDRDAAEALKGARLSVHRSALPAPAADEFYHADLIGLRVERTDGSHWGELRAVHNFGAGDVLEVAPAAGGPTVLLPFDRESVPTVDLADGRLVVADLPGLLAGTAED